MEQGQNKPAERFELYVLDEHGIADLIDSSNDRQHIDKAICDYLDDRAELQEITGQSEEPRLFIIALLCRVMSRHSSVLLW